jgi:uncharacterized protein (DUF2235 family)
MPEETRGSTGANDTHGALDNNTLPGPGEPLVVVPEGGVPPDEQAVIEQLNEARKRIETHTSSASAEVPGSRWGTETYETPSAATETGLKLVLFSDGTGNSSAKAEKTNVWRMFQALDQSTSDQLAMYDDGVGTSSNKKLAALGGAFGWGLRRNVIDLYKFVCRNYVDETTKIYAFGFSRGAFTIRMLVGLIVAEGLIRFTCEEELDLHAEAAYNRFRDKCFKLLPLSPVYLYRWLRKALGAITPATAAPDVRRGIQFEFLGLWDTVSAYGMPVEELRPAISWLFWPMEFKNFKLSKDVKRACHALSLDDERTTFHPILWDQDTEEDQRRITQVWFSGVHSNVGGGYPEDQLSLVSLDWMIQHASQAGLALRPGYVAQVCSEKSAFARIYDSRAGLGAFYRYSPRTVAARSHHGGKDVQPVIHGSVVARMARGSDGYVPSSLEHDFLVLAPNGELLSMAAAPDERARRRIEATAPRTPQVVETRVADARTEALKRAIGSLTRPDKQALEPIHNLVWLRRIAYVASLSLTVLLALFPLYSGWLHTPLDKQLGGVLADPIDIGAATLPGFAAFWTDAVKTEPVAFLLFTLALVATFSLNAQLRRQLRDFGRFAWHPALQEPYRKSLLAAEKSRARGTAYLLLALDAIFAMTLPLQNAAHGKSWLWLPVLAVNLLGVGRVLWHGRFVTILETRRPIASGILAHLIASKARASTRLHALSLALRKYVAPAIFGAALVYAIVTPLNRAAFDLESASGAFCQSSRHGKHDHLPTVTGKVVARSVFSASDMCWGSGLRLAADTRYRITILRQPGDWRDKGKHTNLAGFAADNLVHLGATPLKRWWREPWFAPIAHVGVKGYEEFALRPCSGPGADNKNLLVAEFRTVHDGELFLFLNDAVLALPGKQRMFYANNQGTARVQVEQAGFDGQPSPYSCPP